MNEQAKFRVPRSRAFQTHETMREAILQALEPALFGSMESAYEIRQQFEVDFAREVEQLYAVAVHSGTIGLMLALQACGIEPGDEVITVGNSDISTTAAIRQCGAIPVLCDVQAEDYTLDPLLVEQQITIRTRFLVPVDLYGHPANVKALRPLADHYGLKIVEDAALATGARDFGQPVGVYADATVFSFAPYKPLGSVGNGAMVVANDPDIDRRLRLLCHYGHDSVSGAAAPGHQAYICEGYNVPLDPLQAALLMVKLPHLAEWTTRRQSIAGRYALGLAGTTVTCPVFRPDSAPTFRSFTICVQNQGEVYHGLRRAGIEAVLHYTPPIYRHRVYGGALRGSLALPVTDRLAVELVCLPVAYELSDADVDYVVAILRDLTDR